MFGRNILVGRRGQALLIALTSALAGCGSREPEVRNLVLFTLDTTRDDVLSRDEAGYVLAPAIMGLLDNAVRFPRAYTTAPLTLPAHASILTGLVPPRHGLRDNGLAALPEEARTLPEILHERGFATAAFVSSVVLDRGFGLDQGFEHYDQPILAPRAEGQGQVERSAEETARAACEWIEAHAGGPFFLWIHFYDPHLPYRPAPEFLERADGDPYRGEVAAMDQALAKVVATLNESGFAESTLIALTADHGESLGDHGEPTHGALCYEASVRVPFLLHFPGPPPVPENVPVVSVVDLMPTLLGRLGIPAPDGLDGLDLFAPGAPRNRGVYFESYSGYLNYGWSPLAGWLDGSGKYLASSQPEFYRVDRDPGELVDESRSRAAECERARERLAELLARPTLPPSRARPKDELKAAQFALGYAGVRADEVGEDVAWPSPLAPSDRPSPRERRVELEPLLISHALFEAGRFAEVPPLLLPIVDANPGHLLALDLLAVSQMRLGAFAAAEVTLRQRLRLGPPRFDIHLNLGHCLLERGDREGALAQFRIAKELAPDPAEVKKAVEGL